MSFAEWLHDWQEVEAVLKEAERFISAKEKQVQFAMQTQDWETIQKAVHIASFLAHIYAGEMCELRMPRVQGAVDAELRLYEGQEQPIIYLEISSGNQEALLTKIQSRLLHFPSAPHLFCRYLGETSIAAGTEKLQGFAEKLASLWVLQGSALQRWL